MIDAADLDWEDVRAFLAVAEAGGVAPAAAGLGLSESTVGRRLRRLEAAVGGLLFERLANRLAPTPLGEDLAAAAVGMRDAAAAVGRRAAARASGPQLVRVSATASMALFLATHLDEIVDAVGDAALPSLVVGRTRANLALREADIALRMRRVPAEGELVTRRLGRLAFAAYAARRLVASRAGAAADDWSGLPVIGLSETRRAPSQSAWLDAAAAARGGVVRARLGEVGLRHRAVADGLGASLLPCFLGDADEGLVRLGSPPAELAEDVHLLVHADLRAAPAVRAVAEALAACLARHAAALAGRTRDDGPASEDATGGETALSRSPASSGG